ncbi:MAG TPA: DNA-directed DNA polymerase [Candidatus Nanoarchaeia archaeon]|nr:DNA-directed DNA polymerase [Candidatus Nanoarchaeia archaeon]
MELEFYPYDFEYKVEEGKTFFYFYGRTKEGQRVAVKHHYQPFFYAAATGIDPAKFEEKVLTLSLKAGIEPAQVIGLEKVEKNLLGKKQEFYKVYANYPKAVPLLAREIQGWGVSCYEKDILYVHRYLRDYNIIPLQQVIATGNFVQNQWMRVPVFVAEKVEQRKVETIPDWRILALDLETYSATSEIDFQNNPILMAGLYGVEKDGKEFQKVITWKDAHFPEYVEVVEDEAALLRRVKELILSYNPDILTGYFTDGFDFPYLQARAQKHRIHFDIGVDYSSFIVTQAGFGEKESKVKGYLHLDMLKFIRNIFGKNLDVETYSLDAVSRELLGHKKHEVDLDKLSFIWDHEPEKLAAFCAYNLHDSLLAYKLCAKLLPDMMEFTAIVGLPTFDVTRMRFSKLVESYILKRAREFGIVAPNKPENTEISRRMEESIQGAFVYEPTPGLYEDIVVFDFRSLYPTIISAHNLGPEGLKCLCCADKPENLVPGKEEYWFCSREKKFLPSILEQLTSRRGEIKRQIKEAKQKHENTSLLDARSNSLKVLANSFYGYLGFYAARWYSLESAASTTAYARNYITTTIAKAQGKGFKVVYADTDSCFLLLDSKTMDDAMKFMEEINETLPGQMELELEGHYPRGIFVGLKGIDQRLVGAKKKYALLRKDGSLKITGFETVRRNWSPLSKEVQKKVLGLVLQEKVQEALKYVKDTIKELRGGKVSFDRLVLKTQITRELSSYSSYAPHVKVAQEMKERGEVVEAGTIIPFIIVKGKGLVRDRAKIPADAVAGEYDAEYYVDHQLIPAVASIFAALGYKEEEVFKESSQTGLGKFF